MTVISIQCFFQSGLNNIRAAWCLLSCFLPPREIGGLCFFPGSNKRGHLLGYFISSLFICMWPLQEAPSMPPKLMARGEHWCLHILWDETKVHPCIFYPISSPFAYACVWWYLHTALSAEAGLRLKATTGGEKSAKWTWQGDRRGKTGVAISCVQPS